MRLARSYVSGETGTYFRYGRTAQGSLSSTISLLLLTSEALVDRNLWGDTDRAARDIQNNSFLCYILNSIEVAPRNRTVGQVVALL